MLSHSDGAAVQAVPAVCIQRPGLSQFKVLPFGLSLAPRVFTRCMWAALSPMQGLSVLPYLAEWLVCAQTARATSH